MPRRSLVRAALCGGVFLVLFLALLARLYAIQILGVDARADQRFRQGTGTFTLVGPGGHILDRGGQVLALSVPVESVAANPSLFPDAVVPQAARRLAAALGVPEAEIRDRLGRHDKKFVFLKRKLEIREAEAARALLEDPLFRPDPREGPRLIFRSEFARRYPHGPCLGNVLGFQSEDPTAHEGLERMLAQHLAGREAVVFARKDGRGRPLDPPTVDLSPARAELTIDVLFQKVVEEELDAACAQFRPKWAVAVALDPRSGEVLAVANRPAFDPSHPAQAPAGARLNRAVALPYEPGSTLKPFTAAWALELGLARPETRYDCENGLWKHGARVLHDHDPYGKLTLAEVIIKSSNIGAAKIGALTLGRERTHEALVRFGFGARTGVDLPAEDEGRLFPLRRWNTFSDTSVPMG
ncbi:MAG TPA: penicillin-binding transpeptidase domain-containing protein, partial [Planctomycetota bacterium]|nr:penicillin-binding transpeptidase domain-containing protein [Planctomycetota bacterium]